jgi:hypothetical protein
MITDREIAAYLIDRCYRRMSGKEIALCHYINQEGDLLPGDEPLFSSLQTQFASELAGIQGFAPCRETADDEGGALL